MNGWMRAWNKVGTKVRALLTTPACLRVAGVVLSGRHTEGLSRLLQAAPAPHHPDSPAAGAVAGEAGTTGSWHWP